MDGARAGTLEGLTRYAYDGTPRPVAADELQVAQITTRDVNRGAFPHYLLKEISEAPDSFRKTLRGKVVDDANGGLHVRLDPSTLPDTLRGRLQDGTIRRVVVIGQGTAAVAGQSLAFALDDVLAGRLTVQASHATELSGFGLRRRPLRHARDRHQPERHHDRHEPHRRPLPHGARPSCRS